MTIEGGIEENPISQSNIDTPQLELRASNPQKGTEAGGHLSCPQGYSAKPRFIITMLFNKHGIRQEQGGTSRMSARNRKEKANKGTEQ